jgi:hypothetical protein
MPLIYFTDDRGRSLALDRARVTGLQQNRWELSTPTRVLVDFPPGHFDVRNNFDDAQARLIAADKADGS